MDPYIYLFSVDKMEVDAVVAEVQAEPLSVTKPNFAIEHGLPIEVLEILRPQLRSCSDVIRLFSTCRSLKDRLEQASANPKQWGKLKPWLDLRYLKLRPPLEVDTFHEKNEEEEVGYVQGYHIHSTYWMAQYTKPNPTWEVKNVALVVALVKQLKDNTQNDAQLLIIRPGEENEMSEQEEMLLRKKLRSTDPVNPENELCVVIRDHRGFDNKDLFLNRKLMKITKHHNNSMPHQTALKFAYNVIGRNLNRKEVHEQQLLGFPSSLVRWRKIGTNFREVQFGSDAELQAKALDEFHQLVKNITFNEGESVKRQRIVVAGEGPQGAESEWVQLRDPRRVMAVSSIVAAPHTCPGGKRRCSKRAIITPGLDTIIALLARNVANYIYDEMHVLKNTQLVVIPFRAEGQVERGVPARMKKALKQRNKRKHKPILKSRKAKAIKRKIRFAMGVKLSARRQKRVKFFSNFIRKMKVGKQKKDKDFPARKVIKRYKADERHLKRVGGYEDERYFFNSAPKRLTVNQVVDPFGSKSVLSTLRGEVERKVKEGESAEPDADARGDARGDADARRDAGAKRGAFDRSKVDVRHSCMVIGYSSNSQRVKTFGILPCNMDKGDCGGDDYLKSVKNENMYGRLLRRVATGMNNWPYKWWRSLYNYVIHDNFRDPKQPDWFCSTSMAIAFDISPVSQAYRKFFNKLIKSGLSSKVHHASRDNVNRVVGYRFSPQVMQGHSAIVLKGYPHDFATDANMVNKEVACLNVGRARCLQPVGMTAVSLRILVKSRSAFDGEEGHKMAQLLFEWAKYSQQQQGAVLVGRLLDDQEPANQSFALFLVARNKENVQKLLELLSIVKK